MYMLLLVVLVAGLGAAQATHPSCVNNTESCACSEESCYSQGLGKCDECPQDCPGKYCCCETGELNFCKKKAECRCQPRPCDEIDARSCNKNNAKKRRVCLECRSNPERCCCGIKDPCSEKCPHPMVLNDDCSECICPYFPTHGRVYSPAGPPIEGATVLSFPRKEDQSHQSYNSSISLADGAFVLCVARGGKIMARKDGFVDTNVAVHASGFVDIIMPRAYVYMSVHPFSEVRVLGESVTFCCQAEGLPDLITYTWYKLEDTPLPTYVRAGSGATLTITMLSYSDSGQYICVANNTAGYALSSQATLTIYPPWYLSCPTCNREISLEGGCTWNGLPYYFEARCNRMCRLPSQEDNACERHSHPEKTFHRDMCVSEHHSITISCPKVGEQVRRVPWKCRCARVTVHLPYVYGFVTSVEGESLHAVKITINGKLVGTTNADGSFNCTLLSRNTRIPVRFEPDLEYSEMTKVVHIPEDYSGGVMLLVRLKQVEEIDLRADEQNKVPIPLFDDDDDAVMEFPAGVFLDLSYEPIKEVKMLLTTFRTDEEPSLVPGDFMTLTNNTQQSLLSEGLFSMSFTDGNDREVLMKRGCKLRIRPAVLIQDSPVLWGLNARTGLWEMNTQLLPAGDGMLEGVVQVIPDVRTFNLDYRIDICYLRVSAYQNAEFNDDDQLAGVNVKVVTRMSGSERWVNVITATTNQYGACIAVPCCQNPRCMDMKLYSTLTVLMPAGEGAPRDAAIVFYPADPNKGQITGLTGLLKELDYSVSDRQIRTRIFSRKDGPTYPSSGSCLNSNGYHYRFYKDPSESPVTNKPRH